MTKMETRVVNVYTGLKKDAFYADWGLCISDEAPDFGTGVQELQDDMSFRLQELSERVKSVNRAIDICEKGWLPDKRALLNGVKRILFTVPVTISFYDADPQSVKVALPISEWRRNFNDVCCEYLQSHSVDDGGLSTTLNGSGAVDDAQFEIPVNFVRSFLTSLNANVCRL
eukprot:TRINITY_DN11536_c0_g2_i1.p1 TRINITY_DN11536_c0_g2~~TRINITY_DN11536_c0_g2_i1.p1  ORF type:complete len:182 (+),score=38.01 TRINITY_DN11536_c0_g2_i1:36-548(+)